jgi:hypothetical protein
MATPKTASDRTLTRDLLARLRRHYIKPGARPAGGIFVEECGRNGGVGSGSRCDAVYVGFTGASGRLLIGHEVKVSRSDWRRELDHAGKADAWADDCHEWWVVAPPGVVPVDELPPGWGLMTPGKSTAARLTVVVRAERLTQRVPSWETVRSVMARQDTLVGCQVDQLGRDLEQARRDLDRLKAAPLAELTHEQRAGLDALTRLEELLGMPVRPWASRFGELTASPEQAVAVLTAVRAGGEVAALSQRAAAIPQARALLDHMSATLNEYAAALDQLAWPNPTTAAPITPPKAVAS